MSSRGQTDEHGETIRVQRGTLKTTALTANSFLGETDSIEVCTITQDADGLETFTCHDCDRPFFTKDTFAQHYKHIHLKLRPSTYPCPICEEPVFPHKRSQHMESKHGRPAPTCNICGKKFPQPHFVLRHQRTVHMGEKNYRCDQCDKSFPEKRYLERHALAHMDIRNFACDLCGKRFKWKKNLYTHMDIHMNVRRHVCAVCTKPKTEVAQFCTKTRNEDGSLKFSCNICDRSFRLWGQFLQHYNQVHLKLRKKTHPCVICHQQLIPRQRSKHMEEKHGWPAPTCGACGKKFSYPHQVTKHQKIFHMGERNYKCDQCDMAFCTQKGLKQHEYRHSDARDFTCLQGHEDGIASFCTTAENDGTKEYTCVVCERVFKKWAHFSQHYRHVHLKQRRKTYPCVVCGEELYPWLKSKHMEEAHGWPAPTCELCGRKFAYPHQLSNHHKQFHLKLKEYKCTECEKSFPSLKNLKRHMGIHTDAKDYACAFCSKGFKSVKMLKEHTQIHLNDKLEKKHGCSHCDAAFVQSGSLKRHMKKQHPDVPI
ncbi:hypothetical protein MSG28_014738 [Choristoneura fumiferana]|uniref:Uncharacterized protein n=1 Tax=Choristoneura fumiferana TaxID=7141 RepID=A0ACC0JSR4_CHOFU|nr:hypothetical protein MSG28_014738 [Choristoneura fumiferana]